MKQLIYEIESRWYKLEDIIKCCCCNEFRTSKKWGKICAVGDVWRCNGSMALLLIGNFHAFFIGERMRKHVGSSVILSRID